MSSVVFSAAAGGGDVVYIVPRQRRSVQRSDRKRRPARCALHRDAWPTHAVSQVPPNDREVREHLHSQVSGHGDVRGNA